MEQGNIAEEQRKMAENKEIEKRDVQKHSGKVTSYSLSLKGYSKELNHGVLKSIGYVANYGKGNNLIPLITLKLLY